ncbi:LysM peptidoglycan-binding domain-containing protein [Aestuariibacter sp. AA17]|uniref:LysM peptidoglycan-binding domain-containing protein n=1 Tax=Fluctibacter corallii TaxID=2984329 RepID=A0ABT3A9R8_9ALTE|nr:LysM peptidoglycan-binding domain-containing protein [Aestuariibacter sp. AA17]MCV2885332.1 LysM peptidoglycan-binding domain-containing protein [Aestuariibacter sp. AA17]
MSSLITSSELGLFGAQFSSNNIVGGDAFGHRLNQSSLNLVTGNVVIQRQDHLAMARGVSSQLVQTYNSQGMDSDGDAWWFGVDKRLTNIPSTHEAGSTITRLQGDGSKQVFAYDVQSGKYISTDGEGQHDTLELNNGTWIFKRNANSEERYNGQGQLVSIQDAFGNSKTYTYTNNKVTRINDASGQTIFIDYVSTSGGDRVSAIRTQDNAGTLTNVRYGYDTAGRLTSVTYDLTPDDNSISDNNTFVTRYTYDGSSHRIASVSNSDGSSTRFTYKQYQERGSSYIATGDWVLNTMTDGEGRTVTFDYDALARSTDVIDSFGRTTTYRFDQQGQLLSVAKPPIDGTRQTTFFSYDDEGNLTSKKVGGEVEHYYYDNNGNLTATLDAEGRRIERRYDANNRLIAELKYVDFDTDGTGLGRPDDALVTRYVYDSNGALRFVVKDNGNVSEFQYNGLGQQIKSVVHTNAYNTSGLSDSDDLTLSTLQSWSGTQNANTGVVTRFTYDFRGQLSTKKSFDNGVLVGSESFIYDQAGRLLSSTDATNKTTQFMYDGIGRLTKSIDALGQVTLISHQDNAQRVLTSHANGMVSTQTFNRNGDLITSFDSATGEGTANKMGYLYDDLGRLRVSQSANGTNQYYFYDAHDRKIGQIDGAGQLSTWHYNDKGQVSQFTRHGNTVDPRRLVSAQGVLNEAYWNLTEFVQQASSSADSKEFRIYDSTGLLRFHVDSEGTASEKTYDGLGRLVHSATYEKKLDISKLGSNVSENRLLGLLYDLKVADVTNDVVTTGRDPIQPYNLSNDAYIQDRFLDTQIFGVYKTGGFGERVPNQPYIYSHAADKPVYIEQDSISQVEQIRLSDGRQALKWSTDGLPYPKVELGYRILHNNDQFEYLPVTYSNGEYYVELPQLERDDYEFAFFYKDNFNNVRSQSGGAFTQLRDPAVTSKTIDVRNFESHWTVEQSTGSSLADVIPAHLWDQIENVSATVYSTPSEAIRGDLHNLDFVVQTNTMVTAYPLYSGQVNLSVGEELLAGRYQLHLTMEMKDGSTQEIAPFLYEVGSQSTGQLSQTLSWPETAFADQPGGSVTVKYRSGYRNTGFTTATATLSNGEYQVTLDNLNAGEYYEVVVEYNQGQSTFHGSVENQRTSTFLFLANDQDGLVEAETRAYRVSNTWTEGTSLTGVYTQSQANAIDYVLADVFDKATGELLYSAYTYMSAYDIYNGEVNLSTEGLLADGQYRVELHEYRRNRSTTLKTFDYEVGQQQETTRPTIVSIDIDDLPENAEVHYFFPQLNGARYVKGELDSDNKLKVQMNDLFLYDTRQIPDGLFDMFIEYRDKTTGERLERFHTQVKVDYESHDSVVSDFDNALVAPDGLHEQYYYDSEGRLIGKSDRNGSITEYRYDSAGRLTDEIRYAGEGVYGISQSFETWAQMLSRVGTSNDDQHTRYFYDGAGRKVGELDAGGYLTRYQHDAAGRVISTSRYQNKVSNPNAGFDSLVLQSSGQIRTTSFEYDALGRVVKETSHNNVETIRTYDAIGNLTSKHSLDKNNNDYQQGAVRKYDGFGRVIAELDAIGAEKLRRTTNQTLINNIWRDYATHFEYDDAGRVIHSYQRHSQVKDPISGALRTEQIDNWLYYDNAGRLQYTVSDTGTVSESVYDAFGRVTQVRKYANTVSTSGLTGGDNTNQISQRLTASTSDISTFSQYDSVGRVTSSTNVLGIKTTTNYDAYGRVESTFRQDGINASSGVTKAYEYDGIGNLVKSIDYSTGETRVTENTYDVFGRLTQSRATGGHSVTRVLDKLGREVSVTDGVGKTAYTTYDGFDRIVTSRDKLNRTTRFTYSGNQMTMTDPSGNITRTMRDGFGNVLEFTDVNGKRTTYSRDENGKAVVVREYSASGALLTTETNKFTGRGKLTETRNANGVLTRYYFDAENNMVERVEDVSGLKETTRYEFNALGRKVAVIEPSGIRTELEYDDVGNLKTHTVNVNGTDKIITRYSYDDRGNKLAMSRENASGIVYEAVNYEYDQRNRLVKKTENPGGLERISEYVYNQFDQVIRKIEGSETTYFIYDGFGLDNLLFKVSKTGLVTEYHYDAQGQKLEEKTFAKSIDTSGLLNAIKQANEPRVVVETRLAERPTYHNDPEMPQGQLTELNNREVNFFDANGNISLQLTANGYLTEFYYDGMGNKVSETRYEADFFALLELDVHQRPSVSQLRSKITEMKTLLAEYEAEQAAQPAATEGEETVENEVFEFVFNTTRYVYDSFGRMSHEISGNGSVTEFVYDKEGQLVAERQYANTLDISGFSLSQVLTASQASVPASSQDKLSQTFYDRLGRVQYTIDNGGFVTEIKRDAKGNETQIVKYQNAVTKRIYNSASEFTSQLNSANATITQRWYDELGQLIYEKDSEGYVTQFTYDLMGRVTRSEKTSITLSVSNSASLNTVKGAFEGLSDEEKAGNIVDTYSYDQLGRLTASTGADGQSKNYGYDDAGNRIYEEDSLGNRISYAYDAAGRMTRMVRPVSDTQGMVTDYVYSDRGMLMKETSYVNLVSLKNAQGEFYAAGAISVTPYTGPEGDRITRYSYDAQDRLIRKSQELSFYDGITAKTELVTEISYNSFNQIVEQVEGSGTQEERRTQFEYDAVGQLVKVIKAAGTPAESVTEYRYDALGNQTHIIDARGHALAETDSDWAMNKRLSLGWVVSDAFGVRAKFASELSGAEKEQAKLLFAEVSSHDSLGRVTSVTKASGETTQTDYNANGDIIRHRDGAGKESIMLYDSKGRARFAVDANGYVTSFIYTVRGDIASQTRYQVALQSGTYSTSTSLEQMQSLIDQRSAQEGHQTRYVYNSLGQVTEERDPMGYVQRYEYDAFGNLTSITDRRGNKTVNVYDMKGNLIESRTPSVTYVTNTNTRATESGEIITKYTYDKFGQQLSMTEAVGTPQEKTTTFEYDELGRQVKVNYPARLVAVGTNGAQQMVTPTETKEYDLAGNLVKTTDNLGRYQIRLYDDANRLTHFVDHDDVLRTYIYDANGNKIADRIYQQKMDGSTNESFIRSVANMLPYFETRYEYDGQNRLVSQSTSDALYYAAGEGFSQSSGKTQIIYNNAGLEAITVDGRGVSQFTYYDAAGNAVVTINGDGFASTREYDANGNNVRETVYATALTTAELAALNANTALSTVMGYINASPSKDRTTLIEYDALNRVTEQRILNVRYSTVTSGTMTSGIADYTTRFSYDANGNVLTTEVGATKNGAWVQEKSSITFSYDALNRQIKSVDQGFTDYVNASVAPTKIMQFDALGNQVVEALDAKVGTVGVIDTNDRITTRHYDKFGRVIRITAPGDIDIRYVYDQYGNVTMKREKQTYQVYDESNRTSSTRHRWLIDKYQYDSANRQTVHTDAAGVNHTTRYDDVGRVVAKGAQGKEHTFYEYDLNGRMVFSSEGGRHMRYFYDENGNATLQVNSAGTSIRQLSLSALLSMSKSADSIHFKAIRFDGRNNAIESIDPELEYLRAQANAAPDVGNVPGSNFSSGAASVGKGGDIDVKFHLMASGSKDRKPEQIYKQYGLSFKLSGMEDYQGKIKLEWDTGFAGYATRGTTEIDSSSSGYQFQGINSPRSYLYGKDDFNRYGVQAHGKTTTTSIKERGFVYSIKTYKQDSQGNWVYYKTLTGSYGWEGSAPDINQYNARSFPDDKHSLPSLVTLTQQPENATRVSLYYRTQGSSGTFSKLLAYDAGNGKFQVDVSALADGNYEYYYEATDVAGRVVNGAKGNMTLGANSAITHANTAKPDLSKRSLDVLASQSVAELRQYGASRSQSYNAFGQIESTTDANGNTTRYNYDNRGQLVQRIDPRTQVTGSNGATVSRSVMTQYKYDVQGNQVAEIDGNAKLQTREYSAGKLTRVNHADGTYQLYYYDNYGQLMKERTKEGRFVNYAYDAGGNVIKVDRAGKNDDFYVYNQQGQQLSHNTGYANVMTRQANMSYYEFDTLGRTTRAIDPAGYITTYSYRYDTSIGNYGGWEKTTTYATGDTKKEHLDHVGRISFKEDLGGNTFHYYYNANSGFLDVQTGSTGQNISYSYFGTGQKKGIDDTGANNYATFDYDANGNVIGEEYFYFNDGGQAVYSQQTRATFDELNRIKSITDTGVSIQYQYDAVGNRRRIQSTYTNVDGNSASVDHWYTYDAMNRVEISKGSLENGAIVRGDGVKVTYDAAGRRSTVENAGGSIESYTYNAFGWLVAVKVDGNLRATRSYYDGGYLRQVKEYRPHEQPVVRWREYREGRYEYIAEPYEYYPNGNNGSLHSTTDYYYNAAGQKRSESNKRYTSAGVNDQNVTTSYMLDKMGNVLSSRASTSSKQSDGSWSTSVQTTRNTYEKWDNYKQSKIEIQGSVNGELRYSWANGLSKLEYDANGNLVKATDTYAGRVLDYVNSFDGKVLTRTEEAPTYTKKQRYFYYNGVGVGDIGNDGPSYRDYASVLAEAQKKRSSNASKEQEFKPVMAADFDANFVPIGRQSGISNGRYTVNSGDTLMNIATQLWGDKSLWYLIADANGLKGTESLTAGTVLNIPNVASTNLHNSSETFRPYNAGAAMGDVNPTLPEVPPPPIPPKKDGCGGIAMIVMVVVAVVATVVTAGAAALAMSGATMSMGAAWAAGTAIMTGAAGFSLGVAAAAFAGGFVGSVASQLVGKAMGVVESFSLRKAVAGGLTSVVTAGTAAGLRELGYVSSVNGKEVLSNAGKIWQSALSVPLNVGANKIAGIDTSFSWGNVAVSALSTAVMTSDTMNGLLGEMSFNAEKGANFDWRNVADGTTGGIVGAGVSYAIGKAVFDGEDEPSWNFKQVALNAFGSAIGNEINRSRTKRHEIEQVQKRTEELLSSITNLLQDEAMRIANAQRKEVFQELDSDVQEISSQVLDKKLAERAAAEVPESPISKPPEVAPIEDELGIMSKEKVTALNTQNAESREVLLETANNAAVEPLEPKVHLTRVTEETAPRQLTDEVIAEAEARLRQGDRAGAYLVYAEATGLSILYDQASITTYAGVHGGAALFGNFIAKMNNGPDYPVTLDSFSYLIDNAVHQFFAAHHEATKNELGISSTVSLSNDHIENVDYLVWEGLGMGENFPGNMLLFMDDTYAGSKVGIGDIEQGFHAGAFHGHLGRVPAEFMNDPNFTIHEGADFINVINNNNNTVELFFQKTPQIPLVSALGDWANDAVEWVIDAQAEPWELPTQQNLERRSVLQHFMEAGNVNHVEYTPANPNRWLWNDNGTVVSPRQIGNFLNPLPAIPSSHVDIQRAFLGEY